MGKLTINFPDEMKIPLRDAFCGKYHFDSAVLKGLYEDTDAGKEDFVASKFLEYGRQIFESWSIENASKQATESTQQIVTTAIDNANFSATIE